jgi:hypothetical protein
MNTDQSSLSRHSERSEESRMIRAGDLGDGFFAALRMTNRGSGVFPSRLFALFAVQPQ